MQLHDAIEADGDHLLVTEYIDGPSLHSMFRDFARKDESLPLDRAVSILADLLTDVADAHEMKIIHQDRGRQTSC